MIETAEPRRSLDDRRRVADRPEYGRLTTASALQELLPELVAFTLHAKQAHWNLTGPAFPTR